MVSCPFSHSGIKAFGTLRAPECVIVPVIVLWHLRISADLVVIVPAAAWEIKRKVEILYVPQQTCLAVGTE